MALSISASPPKNEEPLSVLQYSTVVIFGVFFVLRSVSPTLRKQLHCSKTRSALPVSMFHPHPDPAGRERSSARTLNWYDRGGAVSQLQLQPPKGIVKFDMPRLFHRPRQQ